MSMDRRTFLTLTAMGAAAAATGASLQGVAFAEAIGLDPRSPFQYGVAAGDPLPDGLLLWTRVTPDPTASPGSGLGRRTPVRWRIATDPELKRTVRSGSVRSDAARDHTIKVEVDGLEAGTTYYYAFYVGSTRSVVGRARTAPAPGSTPDRLRLGLVSCSNYAAGYFGAYRYLAGRDDLDLVLHVGDYLYEYADGQYGSLRPLDPPTEIVSLEDYRRRHALHKADPDLSALHASCAWVTTIDDHEVSNDTWREGAQNHQPSEGDFAARRRGAYQAYLEWMPVRESAPVEGQTKIYRTLRFGTLADLVVLDLRSYRDRQLQQPQPYSDAAAPGRTMLGATQKSFLDAELARPSTWKLVANSVQIMNVNYPGAFYPSGTPGIGRNVDAWDGYTAERAAVLARAAAASADTVFLTGDIHSTWAADLPVAPGEPSVATEFVCTSVTSDNLNEILGMPPRSPSSLGFEAAIKRLSPDVRLLEFDAHGASVVDVTAARVQCDWFYVSDRADPRATIAPGFSAQTVHGSRRVTPVLPGYAPSPVA